MKICFQVLPHVYMHSQFPFNSVFQAFIQIAKRYSYGITLCVMLVAIIQAHITKSGYSGPLEFLSSGLQSSGLQMNCNLLFFPSLFLPFLPPFLIFYKLTGLATEVSSSQNDAKHGMWSPHKSLVYKLLKGSVAYFSIYETTANREIPSATDLIRVNEILMVNRHLLSCIRHRLQALAECSR